MPRREESVFFDPSSGVLADKREVTWVDYRGVPLESPARVPVTAEEMVTRDFQGVTVADLVFRDPGNFVAGGIHKCQEAWHDILPDNPEGRQVSQWIAEGVDIKTFFKHFKGNFRGQSFNSDIPQQMCLNNSPTCKQFKDHIELTVKERLQNGSVSVWGKVGEVSPPEVIMPLTVEPSKPRLCLDARYVNLWIKDCPFTLETLRDVPRMVEKEGYMTSCDEKSGYDHVYLSPDSRTFFGFQWGQFYYVYNTIPFGWKASPYIYQTIGAFVSGYVRSLGVPSLQYIDDRLNGQLCTKENDAGSTDFRQAERAIYVLCQVMTRLGYTLALAKSQLVPVQVIRFLGMLIDSLRLAFIVPEDKRAKFHKLLQEVLSRDLVSINTIQRIQGKCVSFLLAVPAAKMYMRQMAAAISKASGNSGLIRVDGPLREELTHWNFLRQWEGATTWRQERHLQICMASDASAYKWGGAILSGPREGICMSDYWEYGDQRPIHVKEAHALLETLRSMGDNIKNHRVDVYVDNHAVCKAWEAKGCKDIAMNEVLKIIYTVTVQYNIELKTLYIESSLNPADAPSRNVSAIDTTLAPAAWEKIEARWGPHTCDLMALDTNAMRDARGNPLPHFTQAPTPGSAGVNVFAQDITKQENPYVFPPLILVGPLIRLMRSQGVLRCTMVVPKRIPVPYWWPFLRKYEKGCFQLGVKGDMGIVRIPTKKGFVDDTRGLPWDIWVFRLSFV